MSQVERVEAGCGAARTVAGAGGAAPAPVASLTQDDVLLALGIIARTLARRVLTAEADAAAAHATSAAWAARAPRPDDDEGCLARARKSANLAASHAEQAAIVAPRLLKTFSARATGLCRDTWTCVPPGLSAADADRVRAGHPIWRAIINLKYHYWKETRLSWAAHRGKLARVRELCEWHADIDGGVRATDAVGSSPLSEASWKGHLETVRELLHRGANTNVANRDGHTALHIAAYSGQLDIVRELLASGGANVNASSRSGVTPLIAASESSRVDVVRALLAAGANKWAVSRIGSTAHSAAGRSVPATCAAIRALLAAP